LPNTPHCCLLGRVVLIPYVADSSLKSTRNRWLFLKKYLISKILITQQLFKKKLLKLKKKLKN
jgi:hypothetical protein